MPTYRTPSPKVKHNKQEIDWGDGTLKNPLEFREWWKVLMRVWRPVLTSSQFLVACFVFDRTAAWGKEWEIITLRHFVLGVTTASGVCYAPGLGLSQPTVSAALKSLKEIGLLRTRAVRKRVAYAFNYEFQPNKTMPLPVPKRLKTDAKVKNSFSQTGVKVKESYTLNYTKSNITAKAKSLGDAATPHASSLKEKMHNVQKLADETLAHTASRRERKIAALTPEGCVKLWQDCCTREMPNETHLSITQADSAILKRYLLRQSGKDAGKARDYLTWLCSRWLTIRAESFAWMNGTAPSVPSIRFLVKFSDRFEEAYSRREFFNKLAQMPERERKVHTLTKKRGMTKDTAEKEVAAQEAASRQTAEAKQAAAALTKAALKLGTVEERQRQAEAGSSKWKRVASLKKRLQGSTDLANFED